MAFPRATVDGVVLEGAEVKQGGALGGKGNVLEQGEDPGT